MRRFWALAGTTVIAVAAVLVAAPGDDAGAPPGSPADPGDPDLTAAGVGLVAFDACDALVDHLRSSVVADPWGGALGGRGFAADGMAGVDDAVEADSGAAPAAPAPSGTSDTNVQVAGVDEPDLVETDGRRLFTAVEGRLRVVDVTGAVPRIVGQADLGAEGDHGGDAQLLLHGDRLLTITQTWGGDVRPLLGDAPADLLPAPGSPLTRLRLFDVAGDTPALVAEAEIEGGMVAARGVDGTVHLVLQHHPQPVGPEAMDAVWGATDRESATRALETAVADTSATDWLPAMTHVDADGVVSRGTAVDCTAVQRTAEVTDATMLQVLTLDTTGPDLAPRGSAAVLTNATTVTASADELVVATPVWPQVDAPMPVEPGIAIEEAPADGAPLPEADVAAPEAQRMTTRLHLFSLGPQGATYRASGEIDGQVLNQFSMSLHDGRLRVASTVGEAWGGPQSESGITVLEPRADRLEIVGSIGGLGHGERIYAVRFLGDTAYVVTFRQVDPLYTIDLSDPTAPVETGDLKITGYSAYLHPVPDQRLIGVGQEADAQGRTLGTQVSLFDVSGPQAARTAQVVLPNSGTEAEWDHHAFLYHDGVLVVPYERWFPEPTAERPQGYEAGAMVVRVGQTTLELQGTVTQPADDLADPWRGAIRRAVVVDGRLLTVSRGAVTAVDLATLTTTGSVAW